MNDNAKEAQTPVRKSREPFIFRTTHRFLKTVSLVLAVVCFVVAALCLGITTYLWVMGLTGAKQMNAQLLATGVISTVMNCLFGKWFLTRSEYFKAV